MEVSDQIIKVLDEIGKKFGLAVDWTQKNIIPYIQDLGQRIVRYEIYTSIVWIIVFISLLIIPSIIGIKTFVNKFKRTDKYDEGGRFMYGFLVAFCILFMGIGVIGLVQQTFDIIKAFTLPETIWLEYLQQYLPK